MNITNADIEKKERYQVQLQELLKKYQDKKSELVWADNEYEESLLKQEMEAYAKKIRGLKKILAAIDEEQQVA